MSEIISVSEVYPDIFSIFRDFLFNQFPIFGVIYCIACTLIAIDLVIYLFVISTFKYNRNKHWYKKMENITYSNVLTKLSMLIQYFIYTVFIYIH